MAALCVWPGFGTQFDLLGMGRGVVNLLMGLLVIIFAHVDVTVRCMVLASLGVVGGAGAPVATFVALLF